MKVITLWQPWASWVVLGWKTIETRTHSRFSCLVAQRIGIHAGLKWDEHALEIAAQYLNPAQRFLTEKMRRIPGGRLIGEVLVLEHRILTGADSQAALIDCANTRRFGLILLRPRAINPINVRGKQGIWNWEASNDPI